MFNLLCYYKINIFIICIIEDCIICIRAVSETGNISQANIYILVVVIYYLYTFIIYGIIYII